MSEPPAEAMPTAAAPPNAPRPDRRLATALAAAVLVLITAIAAAPFWAPPLLPLLPWGAAAMRPDPALLQRIERLESASGQAQQAGAQQSSTLDQLARRVAAVEAKQ